MPCFSFFSDLSKCSLMAFTIARFLSICFPLQSRTLITSKCKVSFLLAFTLVLLIFLVYDMSTHHLQLLENGYWCNASGGNPILTRARLMLSLLFGIATAVAMLLLNISMIVVLLRRRLQMNNATNTNNVVVSIFVEQGKVHVWKNCVYMYVHFIYNCKTLSLHINHSLTPHSNFL